MPAKVQINIFHHHNSEAVFPPVPQTLIGMRKKFLQYENKFSLAGNFIFILEKLLKLLFQPKIFFETFSENLLKILYFNFS